MSNRKIGIIGAMKIEIEALAEKLAAFVGFAFALAENPDTGLGGLGHRRQDSFVVSGQGIQIDGERPTGENRHDQRAGDDNRNQ